MNPPKVDDLDYIHFLIAAQKVFTCTEAARSQPLDDDEGGEQAGAARDAFTRLLQRRPPDTEALWQEAESFVDKSGGLLILDDTTPGKPHANQIEHVTWHWSGKHGNTVKGINLLTLLWGGPPEEEEPPSTEEEPPSTEEEPPSTEEEPPFTEEEPPSTEEEEAGKTEAHLPCDFRLYNKDEDGLTKNDHFRQMLDTASGRDFDPEYVVSPGSWYSGLDNLKKIRSCGWDFFTRLKRNRLVNPDDTHNRQVRKVDIPEEGRVVHLKGFGFARVFRTGSKSGDAEDGDALVLGHQRSRHERKRAGGVGPPRLGRGNVPPPTQTVLRGGALPAPEHAGAAQSRAGVDPCFFAVGSASARNGRQFLQITGRDHPGSHTRLSGRSCPYSCRKCQ